MAILMIELPDELVQQAQERGVSQQGLEKFVTHLVQELLYELDTQAPEAESSSEAGKTAWTDGESFARRIIANNRELFEELAHL